MGKDINTILILMTLASLTQNTLITSFASPCALKTASMVLDQFHFVVLCDAIEDKTLYNINSTFNTITQIVNYKQGGAVGTSISIQSPTEPEMVLSIRKPMGGLLIFFKEKAQGGTYSGAGSTQIGSNYPLPYRWSLLACKKG